jgi:hypothetical protein
VPVEIPEHLRQSTNRSLVRGVRNTSPSLIGLPVRGGRISVEQRDPRVNDSPDDLSNRRGRILRECERSFSVAQCEESASGECRGFVGDRRVRLACQSAQELRSFRAFILISDLQKADPENEPGAFSISSFGGDSERRQFLSRIRLLASAQQEGLRVFGKNAQCFVHVACRTCGVTQKRSNSRARTERFGLQVVTPFRQIE